jgi:hypothetical protein
MVGSLFGLMRCGPSVLAIAAAASLLAGCAGAPSSSTKGATFKGEQLRVSNAVEDLQSAAAKSDETKICRDLLARSLAGRLAARGGGCPQVVDAAIKDADTFDLAVQSVQITGDRATARVKSETGTKDRVTTLQLVLERGAWRVAGF